MADLVARALALAACIFAGHLAAGTDLTADQMRSAIGTLAGVNATLLGFLISAGALLYAVTNTVLVRNLQRTGHFDVLLRELFFTSAGFLLATISAVVGTFASTSSGGMAKSFILTSALSLGAALLLIPLGHRLWVVLSNLGPERDTPLE